VTNGFQSINSKDLFRARHLLKRTIPVILVLAFLPLTVPAYDFKNCDDCHEETLDGDSFRVYQHSPFALQQCGECHAAKIPPPLPKKVKVKDHPAARIDRRKINWLGDSAMTDTGHGFVLPGNILGDTLVVELHAADGQFSRQEIDVPALANLVAVNDSGNPPAITNLQVLKVQRGVFLSATIGWQTDRLTDAQVRYGSEDFSQTSQTGNRFGRRHSVVLHNLQPDKTYQFSVVSTDLFGHSQVSEPLSFSTSRPLNQQAPGSGNLTANDKPAEVDHHFQRLGSDYLFELELEQPAAVFIGSKGAAGKQNIPVQSATSLEGDDKSHAGLSSMQVATMEACRSCHRGQNTATHPVNVYPKPGMTIPPEYPTLPDGRITCRSCHETHSSDFEFLTIIGGKRELCIGCHRDMI
jgi:predicted CXXCH cytochrome family protein